MTEKIQPIPHRLKNMAVGGHVAGAEDIIDDNLNRNQQDINADTYRKSETYSKEQLNSMITTPEQKYENYTATDETTNISDILPAEGEADTTYRIGCWDGTQYDTSKFAEYSWDGTQYIPLSVQDYGIDEVPTPGSHRFVESGGVYSSQIRLADNIQKGFIVDYNHVWNFDSSIKVSRYQQDARYNAIIIPVREDTISISVSGYVPSAEARFTYETQFPQEDVNRLGLIPVRNTTGIIPHGTKYVICNVNKSNNPEFDATNVVVTLVSVRQGYRTSLPLLANKKVSIIGASIETYGEFSYGYDENGDVEQSNRYPGTGTVAQGGNGNNVTNIHQTWWMQVIDRCGAVLERVNAIGGSSVSTNDVYGQTSFIEGNHEGFVRCQDLGNPDIIFVKGGLNEPNTVSCTFDPTIVIENLDTTDLGQAYDKMCRLISAKYPSARVIHLLQFRGTTRNERFNVLKQVCEYYNHEYIDMVGMDEVTTISTDETHPDSNGMNIIADYVITKLESKYKIPDEVTLKTEKSPYDNPSVLTYFVDENNKCFVIVYKDGSIKRLALTPEQKEEAKIIKMTSSNSPFDDNNVLKYLTDEENRCFGYIEKDGTVVLYKAKLLNYKDEGGGTSESQFATTIVLLANGVDNINISNNPKFMATLGNMFTDSAVSINGENENKLNLKPCISIIDDDTIDNQIPSSKGESATVDKQGGYFSVLLPFMLSLGAKYEKKLVVGLACEGQRVGFTPIYNPNDNYTALNENGECVKWLHDNMGWNVFNHSMTAQLPMNTYYVDGIESELADQIKNDCNYLSRPYSFHNWIVLDRLTGKWYEINNVSSTLANKVWTERENPQKYAIPFYRDYITNKWYFNRDFDFEYSWGEWCKRADELGLPYEKVIVHNGGTSHECTVSAGRKYAYWSVRTTGTHNYPPIQATVNRIKDGYEDGVSPNNARNEAYEDKMKLEVDKCLAGNTWMVFMSHFNDQTYHRNYYLDNVEYPDGDPNYPDEWVIPLKHQEIQDIIGENEHDYINNPPSRLEISTWDEWYPAPGTQLKSLYDVLDYALSKGIDIVAPVDGWTTHGNVLNLGVDTNGQTYGYDTYEQTPLTNEEKSYLTIGADGSIRYYNSKQQ